MGIFTGSTPSTFEMDVEKVTHETNTEEDWGAIMRICDYVSANPGSARDCLRIIMKRVTHRTPNVAMQGLTLLDACVSNCGKPFLLEVASRDFESEVFRMLEFKIHAKVSAKLRYLIKKWTENEFKNDTALVLIPEMYKTLKNDGFDFSDYDEEDSKKGKKTLALPANPDFVSSQQEEDDIAKAIALSLKETSSEKTSSSKAASATSAYPSLTFHTSGGKKTEPKKARALYDFEAGEENELTFFKGEILLVIDDSDPHWWQGSNHRGEGLFPASFVTTDLEAAATTSSSASSSTRKVSFSEDVTVVGEEDAGEEEEASNRGPPTEIDPEQIERVLVMLHQADPENVRPDPPELPSEESIVMQMGPLIDLELEAIDKKSAELASLNVKLKDALSQYHSLMKVQQQAMAEPSAYYAHPAAPLHGQHLPQSYYPAYPTMPGAPLPTVYPAYPYTGQTMSLPITGEQRSYLPIPQMYPATSATVPQHAPGNEIYGPSPAGNEIYSSAAPVGEMYALGCNEMYSSGGAVGGEVYNPPSCTSGDLYGHVPPPPAVNPPAMGYYPPGHVTAATGALPQYRQFIPPAWQSQTHHHSDPNLQMIN